jgi:hypothetical protein
MLENKVFDDSTSVVKETDEIMKTNEVVINEK